MATVNFTPTRVDRFKYDSSGSKIQRHWDAEIGGLGVEVFPSGKKTWIFRYRIHGKQRIITISPISDKRLDDVRELITGYRNMVRAGSDPKVHRDAPTDGLTLADLYDRYIKTKYFKTRSEDYQSNLKSTYKRYLKDELGHYPLKTIGRPQIRNMVDGLIEQDKEGAARGLLNRARILFNYAIQQDLLDYSPADHIKPKYTTSGKRTVWLDTTEKLKQAWWFDGAPQARALIRWALLTGCRRDEARATEFTQITDETWTVEDTKNGRDLVLPMMPAMDDIVEEMQQTFKATKWLFPATTDTHKALPRGTLDYMIRESSKKAWSMHTLRHTVETLLRELEIAEEVRDLILNHVRESTGERYGHGMALEMKRKGLEIWHKYLLEAVGKKTTAGNAVDLKKRA